MKAGKSLFFFFTKGLVSFRAKSHEVSGDIPATAIIEEIV